MAEQLSTDTIAIVASNLTAAYFATGFQKLSDRDPHGTVLGVYKEFCAELEREKAQRGAR